jgi:Flp pilus assembly protein TadG
MEAPDKKKRHTDRPDGPLLTRFRRSKDGATIVEFGFVAMPFFALLMAILETGLMFFAGQTLDTAVGNAARMIRTGQAQAQGFDEDRFRAQVCELASIVLDCENKLKLDVKVFPDFDSIDLTPGIGDDGEVDDAGFTFEPGHGSDIVVVRAFYNWPIFTNFMASLDTGGGSHLLSTTVAFRNEPFPW